MELEELKNTWLALDERLRKQEVLKEEILRKMIHNRADKALNRLTCHQIFVTIVCFCVTPLPFLHFEKNELSMVQQIISCIFIILLLYASFSNIWKVYTLLQIDFNKTIKKNLSYILKYSISIIREKNIAFFFIYPLLFLFFAETVRITPQNSPYMQGAFYLGVLIFGLFMGYWQYKKLYAANIDTLVRNLEELKELEEE